jgi:hypothetical protein
MKPNVALTITASKRYNLLQRTITTFVKYCKDLDLFDEIILFDDSSSDVDRIKTYVLLYEHFKDKKIKFIFFDEKSFNNTKRHRNIINIWKNEIKHYDFVFHLEDDWECLKDFTLKEPINILRESDKIGSCGFSYEKFIWLPSDYGELVTINDEYWVWPYNSNLSEGYWFTQPNSEKRIPNWPHFGLRPGIFDVKKMNTLPEIPDSFNFEYMFGMEYSKKYISVLHNDLIFSHIGENISTYDLNNSER